MRETFGKTPKIGTVHHDKVMFLLTMHYLYIITVHILELRAQQSTSNRKPLWWSFYKMSQNSISF